MKKNIVRKIKFSSPYKVTKSGFLKTAIPVLNYKQPQSGVYLIKNAKTGKIVYIGYSDKSLYKTIYRHFQKWVDISREKQTRFTYNKKNYLVRVIFTTTGRAAILEKYLIKKMQPKDNILKYENYLDLEQEETAATIAQDENVVFTKNVDYEF